MVLGIFTLLSNGCISVPAPIPIEPPPEVLEIVKKQLDDTGVSEKKKLQIIRNVKISTDYNKKSYEKIQELEARLDRLELENKNLKEENENLKEELKNYRYLKIASAILLGLFLLFNAVKFYLKIAKPI